MAGTDFDERKLGGDKKAVKQYEHRYGQQFAKQHHWRVPVLNNRFGNWS